MGTDVGTDFNQTHPELREGEIFLCNVGGNFDVFRDRFMPIHEVFDSIGWKSKRIGSVAYTRDGKPIKNMRPIFVERVELERA